ncbi:GAF and ANTAR domain-containing protein [Kineococcus sp. NPDC059986]|uniref:GAF and ANTAR domain-containing protein n=1 Tax=Kineococcus sp. NPDC059986 TaxID=3155538 RepID=UPI00344BAF35
MSDPQRLADLADLARTLQRRSSPQEVMDTVVEAAVSLVPGAEHGSISLVTGRRGVFSASASSQVARDFDSLQEDLGEGPCLEAMFSEPVVHGPDLTQESRWPRLSKTAPETLGIRSVLCFQLFVLEENTLGGLNLLATRADAFDDDAPGLGAVFAAHAASALAAARELDQIKQALASRDVIGQAKGMLMERYQMGPQQAFALLARLSQDENVKLHDLAQRLVTTRTL